MDDNILDEVTTHARAVVSSQLPYTGYIDLEDLEELVVVIADSALSELASHLDPTNEDENEEMLRATIKEIGLIVAVAAQLLVPESGDRPALELTAENQQMVALIGALLRDGSATFKVKVE